VSGCKKDSNHKQRVLDRIKNDAIFRSQTSDYHHLISSNENHLCSSPSSSSGVHSDGSLDASFSSSSHSPSPLLIHAVHAVPNSPSTSTLPSPSYSSTKVTAPAVESVAAMNKLPPLSISVAPIEQTDDGTIMPLLPSLSPQRSPTSPKGVIATTPQGRLTSSSPRLLSPLLSELPPVAFHSSPVIKRTSPNIATST